MNLKVFTDGGSRGNPGPSAYGVVIKDQDDKILSFFNKYIGIGTNNNAEYQGAYAGLCAILPYLTQDDVQKIDFYLDSLLVVNQIKGKFKCRDENMRFLRSRCLGMCTKIAAFTVSKHITAPIIDWHYIPRAENKLADREVNIALDGHVREIV